MKEELSFVQNGNDEKKANAMEGTKFHVCNKEGHWGDECPTLSPDEQAQRKIYQEVYYGLTYIQATEENKAFVQYVALNFIHTVRKNYEGFAKRDVERAVLARNSEVLIGHPSERDLKYLVSINLNDCPVTIPDVNNAHKIFGPNLGGTRGKTVR